ncbi:hypothetical protein BHE74_00042634 [Ensete ventricosum]|nr:hypothetical protein BHE74_00042634 [Ensete ventricosum]
MQKEKLIIPFVLSTQKSRKKKQKPSMTDKKKKPIDKKGKDASTAVSNEPSMETCLSTGGSLQNCKSLDQQNSASKEEASTSAGEEQYEVTGTWTARYRAKKNLLSTRRPRLCAIARLRFFSRAGRSIEGEKGKKKRKRRKKKKRRRRTYFSHDVLARAPSPPSPASAFSPARGDVLARGERSR